MDLPSIPDYIIKKGRPHTPRRQEAVRQGILRRQPAEKEVQEEMLPKYP